MFGGTISGLRVWGVGFWGLGFRVYRVQVRVWGVIRIFGWGFRVQCLGCRVQGLGFGKYVRFRVMAFPLLLKPEEHYIIISEVLLGLGSGV